MLLLRLVAPNLEAKVCQNQYRQKDIHDFHTSERMLVEGDSVLVKNFSFGDPWLPDVIYSKTGPASFTVHLTDGRRVRRHVDQVRKNTSTNIIDEPSTTVEQMMIFLFRCRILQLPSHLQVMFLQEQVNILN